MLHSFIRIYVHLIWSTKDRIPLIVINARKPVTDHIYSYARSKGINIHCLNIQKEHVHALISLESNQELDDIVKLLKGESSHWINSENIIRPKFSWQRGYGAFSISASHVNAVKKYIMNQDEHHRIKTFSEEVKSIFTKHQLAELKTDESVPK